MPETVLVREKQRRGLKAESGFTLIEVIASLVIFAIMFTVAGMGIVMSAKGYMITRESAHMAQKAQLAITRISREFLEITDIIAIDDTQPYIIYDHISERNAIARDGGTIRLFSNIGSSQTTLPDLTDGDILIDNMSGFTLSYFKAGGSWVQGTDDIRELSNVTIDLVMSREDSEISDKTFSTTVRPRNTNY